MYKLQTRRIVAYLLLTLAGTCALTALANWPISLFNDKETPSLAPLLEDRIAAIVQISIVPRPHTSRAFGEPIFDRFRFRDRRNQPQPQEQFSGSGVVINAINGYVVTNHHVIENADKVFVTLQDLQRYEAVVVGSDGPTDVALLKIDADGLTELALQNSDDLSVGDFVIAIGNPFGLGQTVTTGIVSGLARDLPNFSRFDTEPYEEFIQTDASINPGNSGGALIDLNGNLIGINTAIISTSGSSSGIGFAIPSNMASQIVDQLVEFGNIQRGLFGVFTSPITQEMADLYELASNDGALVQSVMDGSAAEKAGVQVEDVIVSVDEESIRDPSQLRNILGLKRVGEDFNIGIQRNGRSMKIRTAIMPLDREERAISREDSLLRGVTFTDVPSSHNLYRENVGLLVVDVQGNSRAYMAGLREQDLVRAINRTRVRELTHLTDTLVVQRPLRLQVVRQQAAFLIYLE